MITKTFKIGEYMKGGVCTVEINGKDIAVIAKEWDFTAGTKRTSNQSKAKEFDRVEVKSDDYTAYRQIREFLEDLTSHYFAEQIADYIKQHTNLIMA